MAGVGFCFRIYALIQHRRQPRYREAQAFAGAGRSSSSQPGPGPRCSHMSSSDAAVDLVARATRRPRQQRRRRQGAVQRWGVPASRSSVWPTAAVRPSLMPMANSWSLAALVGAGSNTSGWASIPGVPVREQG